MNGKKLGRSRVFAPGWLENESIFLHMHYKFLLETLRSGLAAEFRVPAELSMDEHMCCGVGVCLACVIRVRSGESWEYQRSCTEGPVFDARQIVWEGEP